VQCREVIDCVEHLHSKNKQKEKKLWKFDIGHFFLTTKFKFKKIKNK
jgi:hypothetical protein